VLALHAKGAWLQSLEVFHVKLDPQKTSGALAAAAIVNIVSWASEYFYHVRLPDEVDTSLVLLLTLVLTHLPFLANPYNAG